MVLDFYWMDENEKIFIGLLCKIFELCKCSSDLKSEHNKSSKDDLTQLFFFLLLAYVEIKFSKNSFLDNYSNMFSYLESNKLIIFSKYIMAKIERSKKHKNIFSLKIFSLDELLISSLKSEVSNLKKEHAFIIGDPEEICSKNDEENGLYSQVLFNLFVEDMNSGKKEFSFFSDIDNDLKNKLIGVIEQANIALLSNRDSFYIGGVALISLVIEDRLIHICEEKTNDYRYKDKTLGQQISYLKHHNFIEDVEKSLYKFKNIRNSMIHHKEVPIVKKYPFIKSMRYFGEIMFWCKKKGYM